MNSSYAYWDTSAGGGAGMQMYQRKSRHVGALRSFPAWWFCNVKGERVMQMRRSVSKRRMRGETITETLVALLIVVVSFVGLTTATVASFRITKAANDRDGEIRTQQTVAALNSDATDADVASASKKEIKDYIASGTMTFGDASDESEQYSVPVIFYGGSDIASYKRNNSGETYPHIDPDTPSGDTPTIGPIPDFDGDHHFTLTVKTTWEQYVNDHYRENDANTHEGGLSNTGAGTLLYINGKLYVTTTLNYIGPANGKANESMDYYIKLINSDEGIKWLTESHNGGEPALIEVKTNYVLDFNEDYVDYSGGWKWKPGISIGVGSLTYYNGTLYIVYPGENTDTQGNSNDGSNYWPSGQHIISADQVTRV